MVGPSGRATVVVDASVSLKWVLPPEDQTPQALALRRAVLEKRVALHAPYLWAYEVTNVLALAVRRARISEDQGRRALRDLFALEVPLAIPDVRTAYDLAVRHGITAYDAAYVALAETLEATLWTGDRRLQRAVQPAARFVRWIGEYRTAEG